MSATSSPTGRISHESAVEHASAQFDLYRQQQASKITAGKRDFDAATAKLKQIEAGKRSLVRKKLGTKTGGKE